MKSRLIVITAAAIVFATAVVLLSGRDTALLGGHSRTVDNWIERNVEARGGADAWRAVSSLRLSGLMDLGQGMHVPYTLEQKRPGQMCLEFEFDGQLATQCVTGDSGWQLLPYRGRTAPEAMSADQLLEMSETASIDGLLFDSARRGHVIELVGHETLDGRDTVKLEVTLPSGAKRWVYLDEETALEVRVDALRTLRGRPHLVQTRYDEWRESDGLLIARRQLTQTEGMEGSRFLTVEDVLVNPPINEERFRIPLAESGNGSGGNAS